jgi:hypothetical protein
MAADAVRFVHVAIEPRETGAVARVTIDNAAKLNCLANGEDPECLSLISACDGLCQHPTAPTASLAACIQDLELLNEGLSLHAPECERGVLLGGVSVSPAGSAKKCFDASKTDCTITGTGETACKASTNNPD